MQAMLESLQTIGVFILFLAARFAVLVVVLGVLTVVFLAGLAVVRLAAGVRHRSLGLTRVDGLTWRAGVYFSPGHSWLQPREGGALRVGLDDLAQHVLARVTEVVLPEPGLMVRAGEPATVVTCGKRRVAIPAPVTGRVLSVNRRVVGNPSRLHNDPYAGGWLYTVQPDDSSYSGLPTGDESRAWFSRDAIRLALFFEHALGMAAADGGELVAPAPSLLTESQWNEMAGDFLRATT
jgi:glycine cleavage system H protein